MKFAYSKPPEITNPASEEAISVPKVGTHNEWVNDGINKYIENFGADTWSEQCKFELKEAQQSDPAAWEKFKLNALSKLMIGGKALATGRRATHMRGIGTRGQLEVLANPDIPENDFFAPSKRFNVRLRHSNASFYDDASIQVRACSIKFEDSRFHSPLDIIMNTGSIQAFWSFHTFMEFVFARSKTKEDFWESQMFLAKKYPGIYIGAVESVRHAPSSWAEMIYHSCICFPFHAKDGKRRYAKFRVMPDELDKESGLLSDDLQKQVWVQCRVAEDDRPKHYLVEEYSERLKKGSVHYKLQIQIHDWDENVDTVEVFNSARYWEESTHPWLDLASIKINEALDEKEVDRMGFWLGHQPSTLGVLDTHRKEDYNSLGWIRVKMYPVSQRNRRLLRSLNKQGTLKGEF